MSEATELTKMIEFIKLVGCNSWIEWLKSIEKFTKLIEEAIEDVYAIEIIIDCAWVSILSKYKLVDISGSIELMIDCIDWVDGGDDWTHSVDLLTCFIFSSIYFSV